VRTLSLSLSLSLSLCHSHTHTHTHSRSLTHTRPSPLSLSPPLSPPRWSVSIRASVQLLRVVAECEGSRPSLPFPARLPTQPSDLMERFGGSGPSKFCPRAFGRSCPWSWWMLRPKLSFRCLGAFQMHVPASDLYKRNMCRHAVVANLGSRLSVRQKRWDSESC
jgi:hypothetical protein